MAAIDIEKLKVWMLKVCVVIVLSQGILWTEVDEKCNIFLCSLFLSLYMVDLKSTCSPQKQKLKSIIKKELEP